MNEIKQVFEDLKHIKILLVDDDPIISNPLKLVFKYNNCFIDIVDTVEYGLSLIGKSHYDIILCVYNPPKINGIDFLKGAKLQQSHSIRALITGYDTEGIKIKALAGGIDNIMYKPYTIPSFISYISRLHNTKKIQMI
ncbi:MAG: response regulator [Candidatus Latescibacteria bacterium]|nr:response regulator [Candidatus Latescibacterota bacterium]